jgi:NAD(P)-dependent dehydrogenase (short-subunit alcohol dehydrogenase family)
LHILVNNAGVTAPPGPISAVPPLQWDWVLGVNLYGVIHGVSLLLPLIRRHGGAGHVVNTASIAGFQVRAGRGTGVYAASKFAIVAYSEALEQELAGSPIGVSVLCPAAVDTGIYQSMPRRPGRFGGPGEPVDPALARALLPDAMPPDEVGRHVLRAIQERRFLIFTHPETKAWLQARHDRVMSAFD